MTWQDETVSEALAARLTESGFRRDEIVKATTPLEGLKSWTCPRIDSDDHLPVFSVLRSLGFDAGQARQIVLDLSLTPKNRKFRAAAQHRVTPGGQLDRPPPTRPPSAQRVDAFDLTDGSLEDELRKLVERAGTPPHSVPVVLRRLGWDGRGGATLEEAASLSGVTRERARQLVQRVKKYCADEPRPVPALGWAIELLEQLSGVTPDEAAETLESAGVTKTRFELAGLRRAVKITGINVAPGWDAGIRDGEQDSYRKEALVKIARRLTRKSCAVAITALAEECVRLGLSDVDLPTVLSGHPEIIWLDADHSYFSFPEGLEPSHHNRTLNYLRKILVVSPEISESVLLTGLRRPHRPVELPDGVVHALLDATPWITRRDDLVVLALPLALREVLEHTERVLVEIFREHGPELERADAIDLAQDRDVQRNTASQFMAYSPIIQKVGYNAYALIGSRSPDAAVAPPVRVDRTTIEVSEQRVACSYVLSRATLEKGAVTLPPRAEGLLRGHFPVWIEDRRLGAVGTDGQSVWGLGQVLRQSQAEPGDVLTVDIDVRQRTCRCRVNSGGADTAVTSADNGGAGIESGSVAGPRL